MPSRGRLAFKFSHVATILALRSIVAPITKMIMRLSADRRGGEIGHGGRWSGASGIGDALSDALVRPRGAVVELVFSHHGAQVCLAEDQQTVEELAAQDASEAFAGRIHARSLDGGA